MSQFAYDYNPAKTVDYRESKITNNRFFSWTAENMYRTSYATSYTNKPQEPKNNVIPGYAGFVPGQKSRAPFGKSFAQIAKTSFSDPTLGQNRFNMSSTGFNLNKKFLADETVTASSHKYGSQTIQKTHPSLDANTWKSHAHDTHQHPLNHVSPTYRPATVSCVNPQPMTKKSGYETNSITFDGKGFLPKEPTADTRKQTEYRVRFNSEKPYQVNSTAFVPRTLKPFLNTLNVNA
jgi:hypothetical protein